jgi:hypothetical protein
MYVQTRVGVSITVVQKQEALHILLSVFVALVIQHAMHMRRYYFVICGLSCSTHFSTLSPKGSTIFGGKSYCM